MLPRALRRSRAAMRDVRARLLLSSLVRRERARAQRGRAARPAVTTLVVANAYGSVESLPELASFFANVERLGQGRLRLVFVNGWASSADRDEERTVLEDLARGSADLGWAGARAVGAVFGIRSLDALGAPLLFPDDETVARFLAAAPMAPLLEPLRAAGIEGLALLPGGMRRPFGISGPLLGPDTWRGKVIRTHSSLVAEACIRALGATPVLRAAGELAAGPPPGVDGMDIHPAALTVRPYPGWLTRNVPLWPRLLLVAASGRCFERLSPAHRAVLEEAARRAITAPVRLPTPDLPAAVRQVDASPDELTLLRRAVDPVYEELRSTDAGEETFALVDALCTNTA